MDFRSFFREKKIIILDGATGTELQRRGYLTKLPVWSGKASLEAPELLKSIHKKYIEAGADVITANTFRTQKRTFQKINQKGLAEKATILSVKIAEEAKKESNREVFVAGSIAPLEDCYSPALAPSKEELEKEHKEQIQLISSLGVDLILIETMNCQKEAEVALREAKKTGLPVWISFVVNSKGNLLSGEELETVVKNIQKYKPEVILLNCIPPSFVENGLKKLRKIYKGHIGVYAHGSGEPEDNLGWKKEIETIAPLQYLEYVKKWLNYSLKVIGGCCGTTPKYIKLISDFLKQENL